MHIAGGTDGGPEAERSARRGRSERHAREGGEVRGCGAGWGLERDALADPQNLRVTP